MKTIDTNTYVSALRELTEAGQQVSMVIAGSSMVPFLCPQRDSILFRKPVPVSALRRGDMVFFQRDNGQFVMHRIHHIKPEGLYLVGDAQTAIEGPIHPKQVFAVVTSVYRKGQWISSDNFWWKFFQHIWIRMVPLRPTALSCYRLLHALFHRKSSLTNVH